MEKKTVFTSPEVTTREGGESYYPNLSKEFYDIKSLVSKFPNDQELGRELRRYFNPPKQEIDFVALAKKIGIKPGSKNAFDDFNGGF
jgi:hypothetical protein